MDNKYKGMTVNERLWVSGFFDEFQKAVQDKDVEKATFILMEVELTGSNVSDILKSEKLL